MVADKLCLQLILCCLVAGCASTATKQYSLPTSKSSKLQQQHVANSTNWSFKGKLGYRVANKSGSALIIWQQEKHNKYNIDLYGPLNLGSMHIVGQDKLVYLSAADGTKITGSTPEALLKQYVGWELPISGLWHWIRGLPVPNKKIDAIRVNDAKQTEYIQQMGWEIFYLEYKTFTNATLPTLLNLKRNDVDIRLVIREWEM